MSYAPIVFSASGRITSTVVPISGPNRLRAPPRMTKTSSSTDLSKVKVSRDDVALLMGEQGARQAGQHRAEGERLELHAVDRDADRLGGDLGLANRVDRAPPAAGQQVVGQQLDDQRQASAHPEVQHLPGQHEAVIAEGSEFPSEPIVVPNHSGRGMLPMPVGPLVTAIQVWATTKVTMARAIVTMAR